MGAKILYFPGTFREFPLTVRQSASSEGALGRPNQDAFIWTERDGFRLFSLADGMGKAQAGEFASRHALQLISRLVEERASLSGKELVSILQEVNRNLFDEAGKDHAKKGMGTTYVGLLINKQGFSVVNIGDSRAYLLRRGELIQLTNDHTVVSELKELGVVALPENYRSMAKLLTRSLGPTEEVEIDCWESEEKVRLGDRFLLCSDGLYNYFSEGELARVLQGRDVTSASQELIASAKRRGLKEDATALVIEVGSERTTKAARSTSVRRSSSVTSFPEERKGIIPYVIEAFHDMTKRLRRLS